MWSFEVVACGWFGYEIVTAIARRSLDAFNRVIIGLIIGLLTLNWLAFIISGFFRLTRFVGYILIIFFLVVAYFVNYGNSYFKFGFVFYLNDHQKIAYCFFAFIAFLFVFVSSYYAYQTTTFPTDEFSQYLSYVSSFTVGINSPRVHIFKIYNPIDVDIPPVQSFMPAFLTAALVTSGRTDPRTIIVFIHTFLLFSIFIFQYALTYLYCKSHKASIISVIMFMTMGGIGWTYFHSKMGTTNNFISMIYNNPTFWSNTLFEVLISSPNNLWGIALSYSTIFTLIQAINTNSDSMFVLSSLLCAHISQTTPVMFFGVLIFSAVLMKHDYFSFRIERARVFVESWAVYFVVSSFLAIVFTAHNMFYGNFPSFRFCRLWKMYDPNESFFSFWFKALGIFIFAYLIFGIFFVAKERRYIYTGSLFIFFMFNFVVINDHHSNLFVLYSAWVPFACATVANFYSQLLHSKGWLGKWIGGIIFAAVMFATCGSGVISNIHHLTTSNVITTSEEYKYGLWLAENVNRRHMILTDDNSMNNPAAVVAGRLMAHTNYPNPYGHVEFDSSNYSHLWNNPGDIPAFQRQHIHYVQASAVLPWKGEQYQLFWKVIYSNKRIKLLKRV